MEGKSRSRRISRAGDELGVQLTRESLDLIYFLDKYKVPSRHWRFSSLQANTKVETSIRNKCDCYNPASTINNKGPILYAYPGRIS